MRLKRTFTAMAFCVFFCVTGVSQQEAMAQEAQEAQEVQEAQEAPTPEQQALTALEKATEAIGKPLKFDGFIDAWNMAKMYWDEDEALQEKLTEWQDNTLDLSERVVEAENLIEDWREKVEELRELLSEGADPDMPEVIYSLITDSWLDGAEGLEKAANEMEMAMAIKKSDTDTSATTEE